jgi:hypothetical protein
MKRFFLPLCLLACVTLFQHGCKNVGAIVVTGLRVELTGIERASDGTTQVRWSLVNPNIASYLIGHSKHKVFLNGTAVGTFAENDPTALPAQNSVAKTSRLVVAGTAAEKLIAEAAGHGPLSYRVDSNLLVVIYGDSEEKGDIVSSGSVSVTAK